MLRALHVALAFMTTLPLPEVKVWREDDIKRSVRAYPLVGFFLGFLLMLAFTLLSPLPPLLHATLVLALWLLLTGALHFDGFCDIADAAFASKTAEERQRIAKDASVGAFALAAGVVLLLIKGAALSSLPNGLWLVVVLVLSRTLVVWPMAWFRTHNSSLLGQVARISTREAGFPLMLGIGLSGLWSLLFLNLRGWFFVLALTSLAVVGLAFWMNGRLDGLSGDAYGALIETSEAVMLIMVVTL